MRILRPALLVLLTSALAGLGVPASFAQTKGTANSSKKQGTSHNSTSGKSTASKTTAAKKLAANTPAAKSSHSSSASGKKAPAKNSGKPSATSAKKGSSKTSKRSRKQPGQKAPTTDRVIEIQSALAKDGSFQGLPNGKWDDETTAAMRKFQSAHGLNPSGKLDAPTLQRLGLGSQTAGVAAPTPPPGSFSRLTSSNAAPTGSENAPRR